MSLRSKVRNRLSRNKVERGTLVVSRNSWHGRLYHFWREHSEFKNGKDYRENLCHYVRVVVFWAPIAYFLHSKPKALFGVRPAVVLAGAAALATIVTAFLLEPGGSLKVLLIALGILTGIGGTFFGVYQLDEHKDDIRLWWNNEGRGVRSITRIANVISAPFRFLGWVVTRVVDAGSWCPFEHAKRRPFNQWYDIPIGGILFRVVTSVGIILGSVFVTYWVAGVVAIAIAAIALLMGIGVLWQDYIKDWLDSRARSGVVTRPVKDEGLLKVGARFAVAKKGKICPFIEVQ